MVLVLALLALAVLMPEYGLAAILRRHRAAIARERTENALKHLLRQATDGHSASFQSLKGELGLSDGVLLALTERLEDDGLIHSDGTHLRLTAEGERLALHVLRAHDVQRQALAFGGEPQVRAVAVNEAFVFEAFGQRQQDAVAQTEIAFERLERRRVSIGGLTQEMFECVFSALSSGGGAVASDERGESVFGH